MALRSGRRKVVAEGGAGAAPTPLLASFSETRTPASTHRKKKKGAAATPTTVDREINNLFTAVPSPAISSHKRHLIGEEEEEDFLAPLNHEAVVELQNDPIELTTTLASSTDIIEPFEDMKESNSPMVTMLKKKRGTSISRNLDLPPEGDEGIRIDRSNLNRGLFRHSKEPPPEVNHQDGDEMIENLDLPTNTRSFKRGLSSLENGDVTPSPTHPTQQQTRLSRHQRKSRAAAQPYSSKKGARNELEQTTAERGAALKAAASTVASWPISEPLPSLFMEKKTAPDPNPPEDEGGTAGRLSPIAVNERPSKKRQKVDTDLVESSEPRLSLFDGAPSLTDKENPPCSVIRGRSPFAILRQCVFDPIVSKLSKRDELPTPVKESSPTTPPRVSRLWSSGSSRLKQALKTRGDVFAEKETSDSSSALPYPCLVVGSEGQMLPAAVESLPCLTSGGKVLYCSNEYLGSASNLLKETDTGSGIYKEDGSCAFDGWATSRNHGPRGSFEWCIIQLGEMGGFPEYVEISIEGFQGLSAPHFSIEGANTPDMEKEVTEALARHRGVTMASVANEMRSSGSQRRERPSPEEVLVVSELMEDRGRGQPTLQWADVVEISRLSSAEEDEEAETYVNEGHRSVTSEKPKKFYFRVGRPQRLITHVRFNLFPDGCVARLRIYGRKWNGLASESLEDGGETPVGGRGSADFASESYGGSILGISKCLMGSGRNLLKSGRAHDVCDGWITPRNYHYSLRLSHKHEESFEWVIIRLANRTRIRQLEIDIRGFEGCSPSELEVFGIDFTFNQFDKEYSELINPIKKLLSFDERKNYFNNQWSCLLSKYSIEQENAQNYIFKLNSRPHHTMGQGPFTHLAILIYPDGGLGRVRVRGGARRRL